MSIDGGTCAFVTSDDDLRIPPEPLPDAVGGAADRSGRTPCRVLVSGEVGFDERPVSIGSHRVACRSCRPMRSRIVLRLLVVIERESVALRVLLQPPPALLRLLGGDAEPVVHRCRFDHGDEPDRFLLR